MSTPVQYYLGLPRGENSPGKVVARTDAGGTVVSTDVATALTDFDTAMAAFITAVGTGGTTSATYSATTHQFTGTVTGTPPTPTDVQINAVISAANTALTALIAVKTAAAAATTAIEAVDVELRMQIDNGTATTGLRKFDVNVLLDVIEDYLNSNGVAGGAPGTDLPVN